MCLKKLSVGKVCLTWHGSYVTKIGWPQEVIMTIWFKSYLLQTVYLKSHMWHTRYIPFSGKLYLTSKCKENFLFIPINSCSILISGSIAQNSTLLRKPSRGGSREIFLILAKIPEATLLACSAGANDPITIQTAKCDIRMLETDQALGFIQRKIIWHFFFP